MAAPTYDGAYVQFDTGRLTLMQIQQIFSLMPFEVDLIDHTDHFTWYSNQANREHVRTTDQLGETVQECHPKRIHPIVMGIINSFKDGSKDFVSRPLYMQGHRVLISYYALRDPDGKYLGTFEFTGSVETILDAYDNGGWADSSSSASKTDGDTGASAHEETTATTEPPDASTGTSEEEAAPVADASTGASEEEAAPVADASTGASEAETGNNGGFKPGPFSYDL